MQVSLGWDSRARWGRGIAKEEEEGGEEEEEARSAGKEAKGAGAVEAQKKKKGLISNPSWDIAGLQFSDL